MATQVLLIRHGETQWNRDAKIQGQMDIPLSEIGIGQARLLANRLQGVHLDAIYSSDLSRARSTAEEIASVKRLDVTLTQDFREINFGEWQGLTWKQIDDQYPGSRQAISEHPESERPPGGETWLEVSDRVMNGLEKVAARHPKGRVAVVSHGGSSRMAICRILGIDLKNRWRIRMDNTSVTVLEHKNGEWSVGCVNDACHLVNEGIYAHED